MIHFLLAVLLIIIKVVKGVDIYMKRFYTLIMSFLLMAFLFNNNFYTVCAKKGTTYVELQDVYYTKPNCVVYAEPTYTSQVLVTIDGNIPVRVIGYYTNGWYRINIGVIGYCKMDSLTSSGDLGIATSQDFQATEAKKIADSLGYEFHYLKLNNEKVIKKDIFNSYINKKAILFVRIDEDLAVLFKMVYPDKVSRDINLNFQKTIYENADGSRTLDFVPGRTTELLGQLAIFQVQVGFDKAADIWVKDLDGGGMNMMNTFYTEYDRFAYAPMTQVSHFKVVEAEVMYSLNADTRTKMSDLKKGIKYLDYDDADYRSSIGSKLRKETEYIDYGY